MADPSAPRPSPPLPPEMRFTQEWLDASYTFGISNTDDFGRSFDGTMYEIARDSALAYLATEIGVICPQQEFTEKHDYRPVEWERWLYIKLARRPVRSITAMALYYGNKKVFDMPADWIVPGEPLSGQVQVVPISGPLNQLPLIGVNWLGMFNIGGYPHMPGFIRTTYQAGYNIPDLPGDLTHVAAMLQAMMILNVAGDLISGAGIASKSVSIDGISTLINTTSSATNAGYGARIIQYWKDIQLILPALQRKYRGGIGIEVG